MPHRETAPPKETVKNRDLSPLKSHCAEGGLAAAQGKFPPRINMAIEGQTGQCTEGLEDLPLRKRVSKGIAARPQTAANIVEQICASACLL